MRSSFSTVTPFTTTTTVMQKVNTYTSPKKTDANVEPRLVLYAGNGYPLTEASNCTSRGAGLSSPAMRLMSAWSKDF